MNEFVRTDRTQLRRLPERARYDRDTVYRILDEGLICHLGFVADGQPYVLPTGYGRMGDTLVVHGSAASRMLGQAGQGVPVCVTVTLLDGLVLARSAFHHSMNYRSVVILGCARFLSSADEKLAALRVFTNHIVPGRWDDVRPPTPQELKATAVLALKLEEASAKVRSGPPLDDEQDYALPVWAGVVPLRLTAARPEADPRLLAPLEPPPYARAYRR
jgi:uncharacterized protein